jgi:hypothetical protein
MRELAVGLLALTAVVPASASVGGSHPWCLVIQDQDDGWACGFDSFEQCRVEARSGNTGFCAANPFYAAPRAPARKPSRRAAKSR